MLLVFWLSPTLGAQVKRVRRVLILYEVSPHSPLETLVDRGIHSALADSPYQIEFHREYMETASFPDPADQQRFRDFYVRKYQDRKPDLIIAVGPAPLQFMVETHRIAYPGVPVLFCLPNRLPGGLTVDAEFTGVEGDIAPAETVAVALQLRPATKHLVVISGSSPFDKQQIGIVQDQLRRYQGQLDISYLSDLKMPDLLGRLRHLPDNSVVLLGALGRDATGARFTSDESGPMVVTASNAPVFSLNDRSLNHGEVGGDVSNATEQGRIVGEAVLRILNGAKPQDIPPVKSAATYMFDWRALKRWGMKEKDLPPGSIVLNRQPNAWELFKWYIIGGVCLIVLEAGLISGLIWQRLRRKRAEVVLGESEARFRLVATSAPVMIWMSGTDKLCTYFSQQWLEFTGRTVQMELGNGWSDGVHRDDVDECLQAYGRAFDQRVPFTIEYRLRRHDGEYRWVLDTGVPRVNVDRSFAGYIGSAIDVTERKQAEETLAGFGGRLIAAQEEERTRVARELHDDINQQLGMVIASLQRFVEQIPSSEAQLGRSFAEIIEKADAASRSVEALSHRLHSSKLEVLGLVEAMHGFCREFSEQHGVDVRILAEPLHRPPTTGVSLCLFRIMQAALTNALKHSEVRQFEVELHESADAVRLTVRDWGIGFDPETALCGQGLGLISMRERARLVNGNLSIESHPDGGTKIEVEVPLVEGESKSQVSVAS